jgi:hypothetical protein
VSCLRILLEIIHFFSVATLCTKHVRKCVNFWSYFVSNKWFSKLWVEISEATLCRTNYFQNCEQKTKQEHSVFMTTNFPLYFDFFRSPGNYFQNCILILIVCESLLMYIQQTNNITTAVAMVYRWCQLPVIDFRADSFVRVFIHQQHVAGDLCQN